MADKKKYSEVLNKLLGTNIRWEKLSKTELVEIATLLNNPEILTQRLGVERPYQRGLIRRRLAEGAAELTEEWITQWEGPFASLARRLIGLDKEKKNNLGKLVEE